LLIGIIEEIPYRGFMLQKLAERLGFWRANLITSLLFLAIHLPGWIALQLWAPILTHSANDFLSFVVFGR